MTRGNGRSLDYSERDADAHYRGTVRPEDCIVCLMGMTNTHGYGTDAETVRRLGADWWKRPVSSDAEATE